MRNVINPQQVATALVRAEPSRFRARKDDSERAAEIWSGSIVLPPHRPIILDLDALSTADPIDDNWRSLFASVAWSDVLRRDALSTGEDSSIARYSSFLEGLLQSPSTGNLALHRVYWRDHPSGVRAAALVAAVTVLGLPEWLKSEIRRTADHLMMPENYKGWGNHCLMQNSGLLGIGILLQDDTYIRTAHERGLRLLKTSVAADGSTTEGSIAYHTRLHRWWFEFRSKLQLLDIALEREWGRVSLMQRFSDHATLPDGRMCGFGDTGLQDLQPKAIDPSAPRRSADVGVFRSGYLFARGQSVLTPQGETFLGVRFGQSFKDAPHGHEDAGTIEWVVDGRRILTDSGMFKYAQGKWRTWVKKAAAHNIVTVPRLGYDQGARSPLKHWGRNSGHAVLTLDVKTIPGVAWRRTLLFPLRAAYLVVIDEIESPEPELIVQRWNVPHGGTYKVRRNEVADDSPGGVRMRWIEGAPALRVAEGWEGSAEYPWVSGWRSEEYGSISPAPAIEATAHAASWRGVVLLDTQGHRRDETRLDSIELGSDEGLVKIVAPGGAVTVTWPRG